MSEFEKILAGKSEVFLQPGEFHFGDENTRIRTLLGSCVAITLWHPERRIGGMCHYMLPSRGDRRDDVLDGRYADEAMELFQREFRRTGTSSQEYEAKLFGGSSLHFDTVRSLDCDGVSPGCRNIACRNVAAGMALVKEYGLRVKAQHFGGTTGCQIGFDIGDGRVWLKIHGSGLEVPDAANTACVRRQKSDP